MEKKDIRLVDVGPCRFELSCLKPVWEVDSKPELVCRKELTKIYSRCPVVDCFTISDDEDADAYVTVKDTFDLIDRLLYVPRLELPAINVVDIVDINDLRRALLKFEWPLWVDEEYLTGKKAPLGWKACSFVTTESIEDIIEAVQNLEAVPLTSKG